MKLPLPTYRHPSDATQLIWAVSMFVKKIDDAIESLTAIPGMGFYSKNHLIQMIMYESKIGMSEENFKDIERYLGDEGINALLRDFGVNHG